jgi:hypothetical protein
MIGKAIPVAKAVISGEKVFRLGFSACTGCKDAPNKSDPALNSDRTPMPNSDGKQLCWTSGFLI